MQFEGNTILTALTAAVAALGVFFLFKKDPEPEEEEQEDKFAIPYLGNEVKAKLNGIINQNLLELYIRKSEMKKREQQKARLSQAVRACAQGNLGEREYVKDYIKDLLQSSFHISPETIHNVIPFDQPQALTSQDKFEIILQVYKLEHGFDAFGVISKTFRFEDEKRNQNGLYYEVSAEDINRAYQKLTSHISYVLKLEVVTQRVFQESYGFGCVDELVYQNAIDDISGGSSGITNEQYNYMEEIMRTEDMTSKKSFDTVWIVLGGKSVHLSFLGFGKEAELIRVCKNLYRYDNVGHLTSANGYKLSYLQNGSRVVVTRPKLTAGWAFFIRKYESSRAKGISELLIDQNSEVVIELTRWMVKGFLNMVISGDMGSGKTTFLKAIFQFLDQRYPIRTNELEFELWLNNLLPELNVVAFRPTQEVSLIDAINLEVKTNALIMILGEISDAELANAFISITQRATKWTCGTVHTMTPDDTIDYFRNAALSKYGSFNNEMAAEEQVANSINIDIHWEKEADGHRHISYIAEIIPLPRENIDTGNRWDDISKSLTTLSRKRAFVTREIIVYENGRYQFKNPLSERSVKKILKNLDKEEGEQFLNFNRMGELMNG